METASPRPLKNSERSEGIFAVNVTLLFENLKNKINTVYFFRHHLKMDAITRAHAARPKNRTQQTKIATEGSRSRSELFGNSLPPPLEKFRSEA
ncbi:hypothetical protein [Methanolapillus millepedarum]|uniref:hypothetical protein n=1 Tax=Methanolapillus millepedarum TaxID=3028296 RepID=UPI0030B90684